MSVVGPNRDLGISDAAVIEAGRANERDLTLEKILSGRGGCDGAGSECNKDYTEVRSEALSGGGSMLPVPFPIICLLLFFGNFHLSLLHALF